MSDTPRMDAAEGRYDEQGNQTEVYTVGCKLERELTAAMTALTRIAAFVSAPEVDPTGEWQTGLHCGVEDRSCIDRYDGADYGHAVGVEKALEWAGNEAEAGLKAISKG